MKIAIIGPGIMPIPTDGWGAIESIIWEHANCLRSRGHQVDIYNDPDIFKVTQQINSQEYDFIHSQYDNHVGLLNRLLKKLFAATSHYGYICRKQYWDPGYHQIHQDMLKAPAIIALSDEIAEVYRRDGYKGPIQVLANGTNTSAFEVCPNPHKMAVCVGKIEPRKQQSKLVKMLGPYLPIDFVGPIVDNSFYPNGLARYLGTWTREELYQNLTDYKVLVLPSLGEAAALVIPEAMAAGCSIVCTEVSTANLDESTPGIYVVQDHFGPEIYTAIKQAATENVFKRAAIRNYAEQHFSWANITTKYEEIIQKIFQK